MNKHFFELPKAVKRAVWAALMAEWAKKKAANRTTGDGRRSGLLSCQMLSWCRLLLVLIHPGGVVGMGCFVERCSPCKVSA